MTASFFCPFESRSSAASFITLLDDHHTSHSAVLTRAGRGEGCLILEVASDRLGSVGSLLQRWLLSSVQSVCRRDGEGKRGERARETETESERVRRRRKLGLITSCIFKQARSPCGGESSILGETHEKEGDMGRQRERRSRLVKWR